MSSKSIKSIAIQESLAFHIQNVLRYVTNDSDIILYMYGNNKGYIYAIKFDFFAMDDKLLGWVTFEYDHIVLSSTMPNTSIFDSPIESRIHYGSIDFDDKIIDHFKSIYEI